MPIIGTPIVISSGTTQDCSNQSIVTPSVTSLYGVQLPEKRRAVAINQGQLGTVRLQLFTLGGIPIDLSTCQIGAETSDEGTITIKLREVLSFKQTDIFTVTGTYIDVTTGIVEFTVPTTVSDNAGVYNVEAGIYNDTADLIFTNQFYLWVNRGLFGNPRYKGAGPPNIDEVRLFIRDNSPGENLIIEDFEFDLADICHATELGARYWNESQPPLDLYYRTTNYPARGRWLTFIAGHLMLTASHRFRRNHLAYQAGGITIDDQNKYQQYEQAGSSYIKDYRDWVKSKKMEINASGAIQAAGSAYGAMAYRLLNNGI